MRAFDCMGGYVVDGGCLWVYMESEIFNGSLNILILPPPGKTIVTCATVYVRFDLTWVRLHSITQVVLHITTHDI